MLLFCVSTAYAGGSKTITLNPDESITVDSYSCVGHAHLIVNSTVDEIYPLQLDINIGGGGWCQGNPHKTVWKNGDYADCQVSGFSSSLSFRVTNKAVEPITASITTNCGPFKQLPPQ